MEETLATAFVLAGVATLGAAALFLRRLIAELPAGLPRRSWLVLLTFIGFFAVAYVAYLVTFSGTHQGITDLLVPTVFLSGAAFVLLVAVLMWRTARDLRRMVTLEAESATDPLTGLANRREFDRLWAAERARARRVGQPLSLLVIDIDHFKSINDTFGHAAGDRVLRAVSEQIRTCVRETDFPARFGGEEFAVIAPYTTPAAAAQLGERIRASLEHELRSAVAGSSPQRVITASIGVAGCDDGGKGCEEMFERADAALYQAKRGGRNRVVIDAGSR